MVEYIIPNIYNTNNTPMQKHTISDVTKTERIERAHAKANLHSPVSVSQENDSTIRRGVRFICRYYYD